MSAIERQTERKIDQIEKRHVARYKIAEKYCHNKDVFDVACGCGYGSNLLSNVAKTVTGGDYSKDAIAYANKHWKKSFFFKKQLKIHRTEY